MSPASSRTSRCLVIACRVTAAPSLSAVIESASPDARRDTRRKRVSSPSAAKTGAEPASAGSSRFCNIVREILHLDRPALRVVRKRLRTQHRIHLVESGFDECYYRSAIDFIEQKFHQRHRGL